MAEPSYTTIPLTPIRKVIAARMAEANRSIPHFRMGVAFEVDALISLRERLRDDSKGPVSLNALIVKATAAALMEVPEVNIQWGETEIHQYACADISVITAIPGGLSMPIVRNANAKSVSQIAREIKELTQRAAQNTLKMHEILGGSFSISNLGMYGVDEFDAIINPPQCAILAVGSARPTLLPGGGVPRTARIIQANLSVDHRAIDGATAARFLTLLRERIEAPDWLAEDQAQACNERR